MAILGFFLVENFSGKKAWEAASIKLDEAEVPLQIDDLWPEFRPDQNFGESTMLSAITDHEPSDQADSAIYNDPKNLDRLRQIYLPPTEHSYLPDWSLGLPVEYGEILQAIEKDGRFEVSNDRRSAQKIHDALQTFNQEIVELEVASLRPYNVAQFNYGKDYETSAFMRFTHLEDLAQVQQVFFLRFCAALDIGEEKTAINSLRVMDQIAGLGGSTPSVKGISSEITLRSKIDSAIWYGLENKLWTPEALETIAPNLSVSQEQFLERCEKALIGEMIALPIGSANYFHDLKYEDAETVSDRFSKSKGLMQLGALIPNGIWKNNKAKGVTVFLENGILQIRNRDFFSLRTKQDYIAKRNHRNFLADLYVPETDKVLKAIAYSYNSQEMAKTAIALERFRIANGQFPSTLDQLVPDFLESTPIDLADQNPLRYRLIDQSTYHIYSIGTNQLDDKGSLVWKSNHEIGRNTQQGDWVWGYPALTKEKAKKAKVIK